MLVKIVPIINELGQFCSFVGKNLSKLALFKNIQIFGKLPKMDMTESLGYANR